MNATEFARTLDSVSEIMGQLYGLDLPEFIKELDVRWERNNHARCPARDAAEALLPARKLAAEQCRLAEALTLLPPTL